MQPKPAGVPKFLFLFVAVGVVMLGIGVKQLLAKNLHDALAMFFSGAMFTVIPLLIAKLVKKQQTQVVAAQQKRREDATPWLRRADWAKREIEAKEIAPPFVFFIAAGILVVIALWQLKGFHTSDRDPLAMNLFAALFFTIPFVLAAVMAAMGVRVVARQKKFGKPVFKLNSATGVIGGTLEGRIQGESQIELPGEFKVQLVCCRQTGGGEHAKVEKLWDASQPVRVPAGAGSFVIPVSIAIPATCEETSDADPNNLVFWRLEAVAKVPGVNFLARFDVPVFKICQ